jgi:hypothetical protein
MLNNNDLIELEPCGADEVERVAVALSMADYDERALPEGWEMAPFYRMLAKVAIATLRNGRQADDRDGVLEEAAKVAEDRGPFGDAAYQNAPQIAAALRALKTDTAHHD